jgi:hypothetical protein
MTYLKTIASRYFLGEMGTPKMGILEGGKKGAKLERGMKHCTCHKQKTFFLNCQVAVAD